MRFERDETKNLCDTLSIQHKQLDNELQNFAYTNDNVRNALGERNNQISGIKTKMNANLLESHAALREVTPLKYGSYFSIAP